MGMLLRRHEASVVTKKEDVVPKVKKQPKVEAPKTNGGDDTTKTEDEKAGE